MRRTAFLIAASMCLLSGCVDRQSFPLHRDFQGGPDTDVSGLLADGNGEIGHADAAVVDLDTVVPPIDVRDAYDAQPLDLVDAGDLTDLGLDLPDVWDASDVPDPFDTADELDLVDEEVCVPDCDGRACGDDGCGGSCWQGEGETECDDDNPCTLDSCNESEDGMVCVNEPVEDSAEEACDDGNPCTKDLCTEGACDNPWVESENLLDLGCVCAVDADCGELENDTVCDGVLFCDKENEGDEKGICATDPATVINEVCPDDLFCNGEEECDPISGECLAGEEPVADDGIECTVETCNEETDQIDHVPNYTACDDGNPCTADTCDPEHEAAVDGCVHAAIVDGPNDDCDSGDVCLVAGKCVAGQCVFEEVPCDDANPCTDDTCLEVDGQAECHSTNNIAACDDGVDCTSNDVCSEGVCSGSPSNELCQDDDICDGIETCDAAAGCLAGESLECDDGVACSDDSCDPADGCQYVYNDADCDDGNPCTDDVCDGLAGCTNTPNDLACDDDDPCTAGDVCAGGTCQPGEWDETVCGDYDHDGVVNEEDACPYAFDPQQLDLDGFNGLGDGFSDACQPLTGDFQYQRLLTLSQDDQASTWRRTHEPVEIPLANGIIDDSVVGYWKLDGGQAADYSGKGNHGDVQGAVAVPGVFGKSEGAMAVATGAPMALPKNSESNLSASDAVTMMLWFRTTGYGTLFGSSYNPVKNAALHLVLKDDGTLSWQLRGDSNPLNTIKVTSVTSGMNDGAWHHVAGIRLGEPERIQLYVDGVLAGSEAEAQGSITDFDGYDVGKLVGEGGEFDEVLLFNRALSPDEIESYYNSGAPYGTSFVPTAQADFDDIRITEIPGDSDPLQTGESVKRSRIIGIRPHSDTACPMAEDDGSWADRDDLCGVVGYWRLDGDATDVTGKHDGTNSGAAATQGRFGDASGAMKFDGESSRVVIPSAPELVFSEEESLSIEAWFQTTSKAAGYLNITRLNYVENQSAELFLGAMDGQLDFFVRGASNPGNPVHCLSGETPYNYADGNWHHISGVRDAASNSISLFVDGRLACGPTSEDQKGGFGGKHFVMGFNGVGNESSSFSELALDEVIIHNVAKSPDYIYHRARPGVPKVRFLANTQVENAGTQEAPAYSWRDYVMYWGDAATTAVMPFVSALADDQGLETTPCYGLLNGCHGYVGWWRFNELPGDVAVDSSTWKNNGELQNPGGKAALVRGVESMGIGTVVSSAEVADGTIVVPHDAGQNSIVSELTLETLVRIDATFSVPGGDNGALFFWKEDCGISQGGAAYSFNQWTSNPYDVPPNSAMIDFGQVDKTAFDGTLFSGPEVIGADGIWRPVRAGYGGKRAFVDVDGESWSNDDFAEVSFDYSGIGPLRLFGTPLCTGELRGRFSGAVDSTRVMNRALEPDEFLRYPLAATAMEAGGPELLDSDGDGILDDGDFSGVAGDNPCTAGQVVGCDDNAVDLANADQADDDGDGIGQTVDNCPDTPNPGQADSDGDGIGDTCDPDADYDHDGLVGVADGCPYAFDPQGLDLNQNGTGDACESLAEPLPYKRSVALSQAGAASTWRRTHEPVELPLANGLIDDSVAGYWKLDGGQALDHSLHGYNGTVGADVVTKTGLFGDEEGALVFDADPEGRVVLPPIADVDNRTGLTMAAWVQPNFISPAGGGVTHAILSRLHADGEAHSSLVLDGGKLQGAVYFENELVLLQAGEVPVNTWTHVAAVYDGERLSLFVNGVLVGSEDTTNLGVKLSGHQTLSDTNPYIIGCLAASTSDLSCQPNREFVGAVQDVLLLNRAMTPDEVQTWYRSNARFGTQYVPGAQSDFDDVRVTEMPGPNDPIQTGERVKRSRVIGPRPHSDTPCPMAEDDGTWEDREDLCGVVGYWRLDGDGADVTGDHDGTNSGATTAPGRFGDAGGAMSFDGGDAVTVASMGTEQSILGTGLTMEAWVRWSGVVAAGQDEAFVLGQGLSQDKAAYDIYIGNDGKLTCKVAAGAGDMYVKTTMDSGRWLHVACTYDGSEVRLYVDGLERSSSPHSGNLSDGNQAFTIGQFHTGSDGFVGVMDEVVLHNVAKSPDYIYNRSHPGVPTIRFLANTQVANSGSQQAPAYGWRGYTMHWGSDEAVANLPFVSSLDEAPAVVPDRCYGLLNGCLGYAGWWRFNEGRGDVAVDSSTAKENGALEGIAALPRFVAGKEGTALAFEKGELKQRVSVPNAANSLTTGTLEASFLAAGQPTVDNAGGTIFSVGSSNNQVVLDLQHQPGTCSESGMLLWQFDHSVNYSVCSDGPLWGQGQWEVVGTHWGTSRLDMFVDWEQQSQTGSSEGLPLTTQDVDGSIGHIYQAAGLHGYGGLIDSVRISNRALSPDEFLHYPLAAWAYGADNWGVDCGGMICPELDGYTAMCNLRDFCEYSRTEPTEAWHQWDVWVFVPPGSFMMGSEGEGGDADEMPVHRVTIGEELLVGKYEVVVQQYEACMADDPDQCTEPSVADWDETGWGVSSSANGRSDHPQNGLTWHQSKAVCAWLAEGGRLPSEAEWEYAAGGSASTLYPWGETPAASCDNNTVVMQKPDGTNGCGTGGTGPVGQAEAGMGYFGLMDMAGNLSEWTLDNYHTSYNGAPDDGSPWVDAPVGSHYTLRSLDFRTPLKGARCTERTNSTPGLRRVMYGARCVRPLPACIPQCDGKECGDDGCGGSCGACADALTCSDGLCECIPGVSPGTSTDGAHGMVWVDIPAGCFKMGCSEGDDSCYNSEYPVHDVTVLPFQMLETEVTEAQYETITGTNPSCDYKGEDGPNKPMECVDWETANAFCEGLGDGARLCSEAEWEYAARAGTTTIYPCGDDLSCLDQIAWHKVNSGFVKQDVKTMPASPYGLYDMSGNVGEWVADCAHIDYDQDNNGEADWTTSYPPWNDNCTDPVLLNAHTRGCGFGYAPDNLCFRSSNRGGPVSRSYADPFHGVRCCR